MESPRSEKLESTTRKLTKGSEALSDLITTLINYKSSRTLRYRYYTPPAIRTQVWRLEFHQVMGTQEGCPYDSHVFPDLVPLDATRAICLAVGADHALDHSDAPPDLRVQGSGPSAEVAFVTRLVARVAGPPPGAWNSASEMCV